jgi:hypothetical protein
MSASLYSCSVERIFYPTLARENGGAAAHCTYRAVLNLAQVNYVVMVCLPCHPGDYFQPLDRHFFMSLKCFFLQGTARVDTTHPRKK